MRRFKTSPKASIGGPASAETEKAATSQIPSEFNSSLPLIRKLGVNLDHLNDPSDPNRYAESLSKLERGLSDARHELEQTRQDFNALLVNIGIQHRKRNSIIFEEVQGITEGGAAALIHLGADDAKRERILALLGEYQSLREVAAAGPQLSSAYVYLLETGLGGFFDDEFEDTRAEQLATECKLLLGYFRPIAEPHKVGRVETLLARFERFRWSYVEEYRSAHKRSCLEAQRLSECLGEAERYVAALKRSDSLPWLEEAETTTQLSIRLETQSQHLVRCDQREVPSLDISPRCAGCQYVIGSSSGLIDARELLSEATRAYKLRIAKFSRHVTKRIAQLKAEANRLDAILKIVQLGDPEAMRFSERAIEGLRLLE